MKYLLITLLLFCIGCVDQTFWGESSYKRVLSLEVEGQTGSTRITADSVIISVSAESDPALTVIKTVTVSQFASVSIAPGDTVDCVEPYLFTVTAEDGSVKTYLLAVQRSTGEEQIENGGFELWYEMQGGIPRRPYFQPGESVENTIWATANEGLVTLSVNDTNTVRFDNGDGTFGVKMKTIKAPALVRIAAGTVFTGLFDKDAALNNPTNPRAAVHFGTPFASRPRSVSFKYRFTPGSENRDGAGNLLDYSDQFDIYLLLEVRNGDSNARLATAWFRDSSEVTQWKDTTIDITYGELPAGTPEWQLPENGEYASASAIPTHLSFVASSSCKGDFFEGAIGSELWLDDIVLNY